MPGSNYWGLSVNDIRLWNETPKNYTFNFARNPKIVFGAGKHGGLPDLIESFGKTVLLVTGSGSYRSSSKWDDLLCALKKKSIEHFHVTVSGEPSPELVDGAVQEHRDRNIEVVVSWGGGSVMDAGKAISAMLTQSGPVKHFLEGVGTGAVHSGEKKPFIALPTTSGTGSEATKNAVLSSVGEHGYKKSLRHDNFVPDVAMIDPELMTSCPPYVTASCGLDAFTQLLESFVSINASPMTDTLAWSGIEAVKENLIPACTDMAHDVNVRAGMAYAALTSGITLANAGLGIVHGLASPLGGYFDIPHGVACGTLLGAATDMTIEKLIGTHGFNHPALFKYAKVGVLLSGLADRDVGMGCKMLLKRIDEMIERLSMPRLGKFGITESDLGRIIDGTSNKANPIALDRDEIERVLRERL